MFLFRCIEKGRYMALLLLASAMEMTKYEVREPQHHNLRWTFLASQETYLKRMITCVY